MVETVSGPRIATFFYSRLDSALPLNVYPDQLDEDESGLAVVFRVLSGPVALRAVGGEVLQTRSIWLAFATDKDTTRATLKPHADKIVQALAVPRGDGPTVNGWRINACTMVNEYWATETNGGVTYRSLGGEFKTIASRVA